MLRILCLHGFGQNENIIRSQSGGLRKVVKDVAEFEFITAPQRVPTTSKIFQGQVLPDCASSWWDYNEQTSEYEGYDQTIEFLKETFQSKGPFDGIMGFSQGAGLASILCVLKEKGDHPWLDFNFAVLISGFKPRGKNLAHLFDSNSPVQMKTLHMIGDSDQIITPEKSLEVFSYFPNSIVHRHLGGHRIPTDADSRKQFIEFINSFAKEK